MMRQVFLMILLLCCSAHAQIPDMGSWTLEEKVGQLLVVHFHGTEINEEARAYISELHVGGFIFYNWSNQLENPKQIRELTKGLKSYSKRHSPSSTPLFLMVDQEGGRVTRLKNGFIQFPSNAEVASGGNPCIAESNAYRTGMEMGAVGLNMNLAPVVDVNVNPFNPIIGNRSFSSSPEEVVLYASQSLKGYEKAGIIAVIKHFPGYGDVVTDPHVGLPVVRKSKETLEQIELYPFCKLAPQAPVIMTAHLLVPAFDSQSCATLSKKIIEGLLRKKCGYQGVIMTDSIAMQGLLDNCQCIEEAAIRAIEAGHDILLLGGNQLLSSERPELGLGDVRKISQAIIKAVRSGRLPLERVDASVQRILYLKEKYRIGM